MIARNAPLQVLLVLVPLALHAADSTAEDLVDSAQVAENIEQTKLPGEPAAESAGGETGAADAAEDPLFADGLDPLFDDDFELEDAAGFPDPYEEPNRKILTFNRGLDYVLLGPITRFFSFVTPRPVKRCLRNFFDNLNAPVVMINDTLQLEWKDAATITGAFLVNSTVGLGGLFEPAKHIGLPRHESGFDQTLALARVPTGPYLIVPVTGPSTARGFVGSVVEVIIQPATWFFPFTSLYYYAGYYGTEGVVTLEEHREELQELERSAVDYYSVLRSAYYQTRIEQVWGRRQDRKPSDMP